MCGRFVSRRDKQELSQEFNIELFNTPPVKSYNIAPAQGVGVVVYDNKRIIYTPLLWGLIPRWSKDIRYGKMINARSETIMEKGFKQ